MRVRPVDPARHRNLFTAGIALMVFNVPLGWLGVIFFAGVAAGTGDTRWLLAGAGVYVLSWCLLGAGFLLAGRTGFEYARTIRKRRKRLRELLAIRAGRKEVSPSE